MPWKIRKSQDIVSNSHIVRYRKQVDQIRMIIDFTEVNHSGPFNTVSNKFSK
jgi:hypothetical protein